MKKSAVIFDLDGTIVDIEPIFLKILNSLAPEFGYPPVSPEAIPGLKKLSLKDIIVRYLGWRIILFPWIIRRGRAEYHKLTPEVGIFPGIKELFEALRSQNFRIGIVSSSREDTIRALIAKHGLSVDFIYRSGLFNKASVLKKVLKRERLSPDEVVYIGDEVRDVEACHRAKLPILAVTWGLNSKDALERAGAETIDTREALLARIMQ